MPFARDAGPGVHSANYAVPISTFQSTRDGLNKAMSELHPGRLIWQTLTGHRFSAR
jgi:hypothetical protein